MSPVRMASIRRNRLTLKGIIAEITFVMIVGAICCLLCCLAYVAAR